MCTMWTYLLFGCWVSDKDNPNNGEASAIIDFDQDGTPEHLDCDDSNPNSTVLAEDGDCDGTLTADDCDDLDSNSTVVAEDGDCDGVLTADDCDDSDDTFLAIANDADCDGVLTADDCNDSDSESTIIAEDGDCDGTLTADDCDDLDSNSTVVAEDGDCDGVLTADDCNDGDASSTVLSEDGDCDGTLTADDCDDLDSNSTVVAEDGDCDGVLTADDCDDSDDTLLAIANDADCDGSPAADDCNDLDSNSTVVAEDGDCDGTLTADDCDDEASDQTATCTFHEGIAFVTVPSGLSSNGSYSITRPFLLSEVEMTQESFDALFGYNPSINQTCGADCPVENVSWEQAAFAANLLTAQVNLNENTSYSNCYDCSFTNLYDADCSIANSLTTLSDCTGFRLPTEAEWEYAARSGSTEDFWTGPNNTGGSTTSTSCSTPLYLNDPSFTDFADLAWYCGNSGSSLQKTSKLPNGFDLRGMYGNVSEWVHDGNDTNYPDGTVDPVNDENYTRIVRGGAYDFSAPSCSPGNRMSNAPNYSASNIGFRLARTIHP